MALPVSDEVIEQLAEDMNSVSDNLNKTSVDLKDSVTVLTKENEIKKNVVDDQKKRPYLTITERKRFSLMSSIFESSFFQKLRDFRDQTLKEKAMTIAKTAMAPVSLAWRAGKSVVKGESIFTKILKWLGIGFLIYQLFGDRIKNFWEHINPAIRQPIENVANRIIGIFEELAGTIKKSIADWFLNGGITNIINDFFGKDVMPALNRIFELFYNSSDNEYVGFWQDVFSLAKNTNLSQEQAKSVTYRFQRGGDSLVNPMGMRVGSYEKLINDPKRTETEIASLQKQREEDKEQLNQLNSLISQLYNSKVFQKAILSSETISKQAQNATVEQYRTFLDKSVPDWRQQDKNLAKTLDDIQKYTQVIDAVRLKESLKSNSQKQLEEDAKKQAALTEQLNKELNPEAIRQSTQAAAVPFIQKMESIVNTLHGDVLTIDLTKALKESISKLTDGLIKNIGDSLNTIKTSVDNWIKNTKISLATTVQAKAAEITVTTETGDNIQNATTEIEQNNITRQGKIEDIKASININNMNLPSLEQSINDMNEKQRRQITLLESQNKSLSSVLQSMTSFSNSATLYFNKISTNNSGKPVTPLVMLNTPTTGNSGFYNAATLKNTQSSIASAFLT